MTSNKALQVFSGATPAYRRDTTMLRGALSSTLLIHRRQNRQLELSGSRRRGDCDLAGRHHGQRDIPPLDAQRRRRVHHYLHPRIIDADRSPQPHG